MSKAFKDLEIGELFHRGKSKGMGARSHVTSWEVFVEANKSTATCIEQHGDYHRSVGNVVKISAWASVWPVEPGDTKK